MSKQIALSIEQMKHLEELGLDTSDAKLGNVCNRLGIKVFTMSDYKTKWDFLEGWTVYPTYTLQDILYKLPNNNKNWIEINMDYSEIELIESVDDEPFVNIAHYVNDKDLLNDAYDMLCWCIENGYIKTDKDESNGINA